ncbi:MAG: hypothetical protein CL780_00620 [Chloroflexi bacterium]|nr:hypothetical protein [Chloroflexota bacterium]|tara:strand:- start:442 stop:1434 length:993 start_codon:yes stop_codon:yes gene_type:complete
MSDVSIQNLIYKPISENLDIVIREIINESEQVPKNASGIGDRLQHILSVPGKRIRPAITLLCAGLWENKIDKLVLKMAIAVELLHIATLVHDDTVDKADTRRGHATASNLWGRNIAVLLGDHIFATSAMYVCETGNIRLIKRFAETISELACGELDEILSTWQTNTTVDLYNKRIYNKTATLFSTAALGGAILGGASNEDVLNLREYGYNLGMAYQIYDDILDYTSTADKLGKPSGNDLLSGVITLPAIIAYENGCKELIDDYVKSSKFEQQTNIHQVISKIKNTGSVKIAKKIADEHILKTKKKLSNLPNNENLKSLKLLSDYIADRSY